MGDFDIKGFLNKLLDLSKTWISKFNHSSGIHANEMIVVLEFMRSFKLCTIITKLMLAYQTAVKKQVNGIV